MSRMAARIVFAICLPTLASSTPTPAPTPTPSPTPQTNSPSPTPSTTIALTGQVQKIVQDVTFSSSAFNSFTSASNFLGEYKKTVVTATGTGTDKVNVVLDKVKVMATVVFNGVITQANLAKLTKNMAAHAGVSESAVSLEIVTSRLLTEAERALTGTTKIKATFDVPAGATDPDPISKAQNIKTLMSDKTKLTNAVKTDFPSVTASSVGVTYKVTVKIEVQTTATIDQSNLDSKISTGLGGTATTTSVDTGVSSPSPSPTPASPSPAPKKGTNGSPPSSGYIFTAFIFVFASITKTLV